MEDVLPNPLTPDKHSVIILCLSFLKFAKVRYYQLFKYHISQYTLVFNMPILYVSVMPRVVIKPLLREPARARTIQCTTITCVLAICDIIVQQYVTQFSSIIVSIYSLMVANKRALMSPITIYDFSPVLFVLVVMGKISNNYIKLNK